jgi:hypothetical protein
LDRISSALGGCRAVENVADYLVGKEWRQEGRPNAHNHRPVYEDEKPRRIEQIEISKQPVRRVEEPRPSSWSLPRVGDERSQGWGHPSRKGGEIEGETSSQGWDHPSRKGVQIEGEERNQEWDQPSRKGVQIEGDERSQGWGHPSRKGMQIEGETSDRERGFLETSGRERGFSENVSSKREEGRDGDPQPGGDMECNMYKSCAGFEGLAKQVTKTNLSL